ncbi:MAG TPA: hypothetical protein VGV59_00830 [Pyrinomonadaceae bacterium]|nr:hypothetical protein [Pyrinomonadaceae bacterium]
MSIAPEQTAIMAYLKTLDEGYHAKILELRKAVEGWLAYTPQTFPHYTLHTIQHSDEIVRQVSKILFRDDDSSRPVIKLSAAEAYVLVAAAYLHDAGMVTADKVQFILLNAEHRFVQWLERVKVVCQTGLYGFRDEFQRVFHQVDKVTSYHINFDRLNKYLEEWSKLPNLPAELYPPLVELTREMFILEPPE